MKLTHWFSLLALAVSLPAQAVVTVQDDAGKTVTLERPAQRIVSLAPHATELIFAAGGGDRIVGTVGYSDYPPAALKIPRVGNHQQVDIERIIASKPDLLVVWLHGNSERQLEHVRKLGIPFYFSEPKKLDDIPRSIERLGVLMGTEQQAARVATQQRARLATLAAQYRERPVVRMFYQVWGKPIYTLNGSNIMSDVIRLCGGENVFASLPVSAPTVSTEAVLLENPEVMMTGDRQAEKSGGLEIWRPYRNLLAVRNDNLFSVDADLVNRAGPRLIDGAAMVCEKLEQARSRRTGTP
ncbi:cobalamin-binding protein [Oxalicibacterium flavum]|uniref:Cobalamin-binding protein n=1 Tax=Oxalicibacterium flavum TaxID=179467 RepID=A0A8J2UQF1_9BURK|nr:cobalamin-binding protein [Oxalicibacterium flavum]GGC10829.1 cobalamin-binding protein [Oxalicibacterium flavum]